MIGVPGRTTLRRLLALLISLIVSVGIAVASTDDADVVVITHPSVSATTFSLSENRVRAIFGLQVRHWPDGRAIRVFVFPDDSSLHHQFTKRFLGMYPYQLRRRWDRILFSGRGIAPTEISTSDEMVRQIANTPGAIGYVDRAATIAMPVLRIWIDD